MPTSDGPQNACFREVEVERIVLREPGGHHRVRAVLETTPAPADPDDDRRAYPVVRLSLLDVAGDTALVFEVNGPGEPSVHIGAGHRNVVVTRYGVALRAGGNEVAALDSGEGGQLVLCDDEGRMVLRLPTGD